MVDPNLIKTLEQTGFDEKEARAYLALLELGRGNASEIAKKAELKRAIVYHVLERLMKAGYAHEIPGKKVRQFSITGPTKLLQNFQTALDDFKFMLPVMQAVQSKGQDRPRVEFLEGKKAIMTVYRLHENDTGLRFLTSIKRFNKIIPQEIEAWVERYKAGTVTSLGKNLISDTPEDRNWAEQVQKYADGIRILPKGVEMEMDFMITDAVLAITSFDPLFIVVIHSQGIARSAAQLFDLSWKQGSKLG